MMTLCLVESVQLRNGKLSVDVSVSKFLPTRTSTDLPKAGDHVAVSGSGRVYPASFK